MQTQPQQEHPMPCPFCGCRLIRTTDWWDDDGEYDAYECELCKGTAPASVWNQRHAATTTDQ